MTALVTGINTTAIGNASVTIPSHNVGDLIVIWAYRSTDNTVPTKPAASGTVPAWVDIDNSVGTGTCCGYTACFVATATNHTSGTWTNANQMIAVVISGQDTSPIGGHAKAGGSTSTAATAPAVTLSRTDGSSLLLHFYGGRNISSYGTTPTGYTNKANTTNVCCDAKNDTTTDGSVVRTITASTTGTNCATVEVLALPSTQGNFFAVF